MNQISFSKNIFRGRLGRRLAAMIVLFSSCFALASTIIQLSFDYRTDINRIEESFANIESAYLQSVTLSVWALDNALIEAQLDGLQQLPDIEYVAVVHDGEMIWQMGSQESSNTMQRNFPLVYKARNIPDQNIGELIITASMDEVYSRLISKGSIILISNGIKTFLVSGFILFLIWLTITRHLTRIGGYLLEFQPGSRSPPLDLHKKRSGQRRDEIDMVTDTINDMRQRIETSYRELDSAKTELEQLLDEREVLLEKELLYKNQLEMLVAERTAELEQSLGHLKETQNLLVENEKMAALGGMVAGVAHEINTPIGVCLTAASYQSDQIDRLQNLLETGQLKRSELDNVLSDVDQAAKLFQANIAKAGALIANFKQIATDQSYDTLQSFNLKHYVDASLQTVMPAYKHQGITFINNIPASIRMNSYPGSIHQILTNLISNSIIHGFTHNKGGIIRITASEREGEVELVYFDNGRGMTEQEQQHVFEPFYTSRRGHGGSGLGMSIIFNTVQRILKGQISVLPVNQFGTSIRISIPLDTDIESGGEVTV